MSTNQYSRSCPEVRTALALKQQAVSVVFGTKSCFLEGKKNHTKRYKIYNVIEFILESYNIL